MDRRDGTPSMPGKALIKARLVTGLARGGSMDAEVRLKHIGDALDQLAGDTSIPRNIRRGAKEAKDILSGKEPARNGDEPEEMDVRIARANSILDQLADDPNIPLHGRTLIWNIITQLETVE